jgi:hypothetical protein
MIMAEKTNPFRDYLYSLGRQPAPEYAWQWFFRYFAGGPSIFPQEPSEMLANYKSLIHMASELLKGKYTNGTYSKFIKDSQTPDYTYYIIGDTHGSFSDVYIMIDYFIKVLQVNPKIKFVWIGDFVDRNPYDLQNLAFILSFWLLFPDNVFLIRGNHEDSSVCSRYGFSQHLYDKAGSRPVFQEIWDMVIAFFSNLPIGLYARIGDKNVWIVHGGIPFNVDDYQPIRLLNVENQINCFHAEYFDMDPISTSMLWSDPDTALAEGVAPNPRSGRPRFSRQAFDDFMQLNHFDCLLRGHEKWNSGYNLFFENRLISLFSTSTYDGRTVGEAKFLRFMPDMSLENIGNEQNNEGKGILAVEPTFLDKQLLKYYNAKTKVN